MMRDTSYEILKRSDPTKQRIVIINHAGLRCGVFQFGKNLAKVLSFDARVEIKHLMCASEEDLSAQLENVRPDILIANHHPATLPWLTESTLQTFSGPKFLLVHEFSSESANYITVPGYDFYLCADPTLVPFSPRVLPVPRFAPVVNTTAQPAFGVGVPTIGSFGFASPNKQFAKICELAAQQFDRAIVRINIPNHDNPDIIPDAVREQTITECLQALEGTSIELKISDHFFSDEDLVNFCADNHLNVLAYEQQPGRGISSCADVLLASGRPFLISDSMMFRHMHAYQPSVRLAEVSLLEAINYDPALFDAARAELRPESVSRIWIDTILKSVARKSMLETTPDGQGFNKILDSSSQFAYSKNSESERIQRDIKPAKNSKDAVSGFFIDTVSRLARQLTSPRILAIHEVLDQTSNRLRRSGYSVTSLEVGKDLSLNDFYLSATTAQGSYDIIYCASILNPSIKYHDFLKQCVDLLSPGGALVLAANFKDNEVNSTSDNNEQHFKSLQFKTDFLATCQLCRLYDEGNWDDAAPADFEGDERDQIAAIVLEKLKNVRFYRDADNFNPIAAAAWRAHAAHPVHSHSNNTTLGGAPRHFLTSQEISHYIRNSGKIDELNRHNEALAAENNMLKKRLDSAHETLSDSPKLFKALALNLVGKPVKIEDR